MSRNKSAKSKLNLDKEYQLTKSDTFCISPWIHLHTAPNGLVAPCCIAETCSTVDGFGNSRDTSIKELINVKQMKDLRLDMLNGVKNPECNKCHRHEENNIKSFRQMINEEFKDFYDDAVLDNTKQDGSLKEFKMRYFDMRFSNICNFKCRTCGFEFSSQWEQENLKNGVSWARILPKNNKPKFIEEVLTHIDHIEAAYFAGGEPLITEEHYIMLEEMIRRKRTDIKLRYNTNLSNLKFKDKDLLALWKHFTNSIDVYASIDHYGERAEYIRHGTDWATVENNFITVQKTPYLNLYVNTVLSVFNYLTLDEFYKYLIDKKLYKPKLGTYTIYKMSGPEHLTAHVLPKELKLIGKTKIDKLYDFMKTQKFAENQLIQVSDINPWVLSSDTWEQQRDIFQSEVRRIDNIRGEKFVKTFPELASMMRHPRERMFPL